MRSVDSKRFFRDRQSSGTAMKNVATKVEQGGTRYFLRNPKNVPAPAAPAEGRKPARSVLIPSASP